MKKIIYVIMVTLLIPYFAIMQPVSIDAKTTTYCGAYSNLVDAKSQKEVRKVMLDAGLSRKNVDAWLAEVKTYNKTIKNTGLVKKGFKKMTKSPQYDENKIMELWSKKNDLFIGYNCRITAFDLMKDKIKVDENAKANPTELFMDQDALKNAPEKKFTKKQTATFEKLFSTVNTEYTTDVDTHVKKMQKSLKAKGVTISKKTKASLITVVFHSSFGKEENELFVGHAGVLVPTRDGKLLFVEKLSFSLPYQVIKFDNRKQLYQYLMGMYDTQWGQKEAKPFIMENTRRMKC